MLLPTTKLDFYDLANATLLSLATIMLNGFLILKRRRQFLFFSISYLAFLLLLHFLALPTNLINPLILCGNLLISPFLFFLSNANWRHPYWASLGGTNS
jgi:hypothetical protein